MSSVGRPTKYRKEYCDLLIEHMSKGLSIESFAGVVKATKKTIYEWMKQHPEFLYAAEQGSALSQLKWEQIGIDGVFSTSISERTQEGFRSESKAINASVWKFNMQNRFGWREKVEQQVQSEEKAKLVIRIKEPKKSDE